MPHSPLSPLFCVHGTLLSAQHILRGFRYILRRYRGTYVSRRSTGSTGNSLSQCSTICTFCVSTLIFRAGPWCSTFCQKRRTASTEAPGTRYSTQYWHCIQDQRSALNIWGNRRTGCTVDSNMGARARNKKHVSKKPRLLLRERSRKIENSIQKSRSRRRLHTKYYLIAYWSRVKGGFNTCTSWFQREAKYLGFETLRHDFELRNKIRHGGSSWRREKTEDWSFFILSFFRS